jgi:hypothetical protein
MRKITVILSLVVLMSVSVAYASDRDMDNFAKINTMFTNDIASVARYCDLNYMTIVDTSAPANPEAYSTYRTARIYTHADYVKARVEFEAKRQAGTALYIDCPLKSEYEKLTGGMKTIEDFIAFQPMTK